VGVVKADPPQVRGGGGVQVAAERQLDGPRADVAGTGDIGDRDVLVGMSLDEGHRPAQRAAMSIAAVLDGRLAHRGVREDRQGRRGHRNAARPGSHRLAMGGQARHDRGGFPVFLNRTSAVIMNCHE